MSTERVRPIGNPVTHEILVRHDVETWVNARSVDQLRGGVSFACASEGLAPVREQEVAYLFMLGVWWERPVRVGQPAEHDYLLDTTTPHGRIGVVDHGEDRAQSVAHEPCLIPPRGHWRRQRKDRQLQSPLARRGGEPNARAKRRHDLCVTYSFASAGGRPPRVRLRSPVVAGPLGLE